MRHIRISNILSLALLLSLALGVSASDENSFAPVKAPPNVVLFLTDDLGWRDLACYGSEFYESPNIDRFASEGVSFSQAYAAHPRCVPSRHAIFTGRYPARTGRRNGGNTKLERVTIAEALKDAGYATFFIGKWHLGNEGAYPDDQGFDINIAGYHGGATKSHFAPYGAEKGKTGELIPGLEDAPEGEYLADRITAEAVNYIENAPAGAPFFMAVCHYAVHTPIQAKADVAARYADKLKSMPPFDQPEYIDEGTGQTKMRQDDPEYAAMVESVDDSLGGILAALKARGLDDNTVVIFTSDHGGLSNRGLNNRRLATSNYPLRAGKGWLFEGGTRVPLIVRWPGVTKAGAKCEAVATGVDLYPTILDMVGLPLRPKEHLDGKSFASALRGEPFERGPIFWHSPNGRPHSTGDTNSTALRKGNFKMVEWYDEDHAELFDLSTDLGEQHDLSNDMPEVAASMLEEIHAWRDAVNAWKDPDPKATLEKNQKRWMRGK